MGQCLCPTINETTRLVSTHEASTSDVSVMRARTNIIIMGALGVGKSSMVSLACNQLKEAQSCSSSRLPMHDESGSRQTHTCPPRYERTIAVDVQVMKLPRMDMLRCGKRPPHENMWVAAAIHAKMHYATRPLCAYIAQSAVECIPDLYSQIMSRRRQAASQSPAMINRNQRTLTMSTSPITSSMSSLHSGTSQHQQQDGDESTLTEHHEERAIDIDEVISCMMASGHNGAETFTPKSPASAALASANQSVMNTAHRKGREQTAWILPWSGSRTQFPTNIRSIHHSRQQTRTDTGEIASQSRVLMWDTSGDVKFVPVVTQYICSAHLIALMYDPANADTIDYIRRYWVRRIEDMMQTKKRRIIILRNSSSAAPFNSLSFKMWQKSRISTGSPCPSTTDEEARYEVLCDVDKEAIYIAIQHFEGCPIICVQCIAQEHNLPVDFLQMLVRCTHDDPT